MTDFDKFINEICYLNVKNQVFIIKQKKTKQNNLFLINCKIIVIKTLRLI